MGSRNGWIQASGFFIINWKKFDFLFVDHTILKLFTYESLWYRGPQYFMEEALFEV